MASIETDNEKPKEIWKATITNVDEKEFEETRRCLLNSYNSYVQTHAGYIISLIVGLTVFIATVISTSNTILKSIGGTITFSILIIGIVVFIISIFYMSLRIVYWTLWASVALTIPEEKVFYHFNTRKISIPIDKTHDYFNTINDENRDYFSKAPNTDIIQVAIGRQLYDFDKVKLPWYKKLALKT